jgi:hypothetical protein
VGDVAGDKTTQWWEGYARKAAINRWIGRIGSTAQAAAEFQQSTVHARQSQLVAHGALGLRHRGTTALRGGTGYQVLDSIR